ncbi:adenosine receptor A1-like [Montipora foliosa]|uniref:adenosine receptor A1-like n=1 Tax=Montipora foliosa TaxID=591990 RepID=UPI0035F171F0
MNSTKTGLTQPCQVNDSMFLVFLFENQQYRSSTYKAGILVNTIILLVAFPFTIALNALVIVAVKVKPRLREHKSNILLALLVLTDFMVGAFVQPTYIVVLVKGLLDHPRPYRVVPILELAIGISAFSSLLHLALISGERYLAMKHSFAYLTLVTDARLLVASALAWIFDIILHGTVFVFGKAVSVRVANALVFTTTAFIAFCRETRRLEHQMAAQQVTEEARKQFQRNKKALKLTSIIILLIVMCYLPFGAVTVTFASTMQHYQTSLLSIFVASATSILLMNSLFNPILYSVRIRELRVAMIELIFRTTQVAETEEIEKGLFGARRAASKIHPSHTENTEDVA